MPRALRGTSEAGDAGLVRTIGTRTLAFSIVNTTVGAGIFLLPGVAAANLGAAAPLAYGICALAMALIVACFASAGSRVSVTGGPYAYVEVAFGPFVGFLVGTLLWLTNVLGVAGIATAFASAIGMMAPAFTSPAARALLLSVVLGGLALLNIRGTRLGTHTIVAATAAKLAPLVLFVVVGLFFVQPGATRWPGLPPASALGDTVLILLFAFVGMEVALVPSGEVENPARAVPRAVFGALGLTTALYLAIQFVAQGVLGASLAGDLDAPLAEASAAFLGNAGRAVILAGGAVSMFGYLSGDMLATPRLLFAFGRDGFIPPVFARVHPRFHTPHVAIATHALIVLALGLWGTFGQLVLLSNVAVLTLYFVCCAAAWQLGRKAVDTGEADTAFRVVGGPAVPLAACAVIAWILAHATRAEFTVELVVLALASGAYALRRWRRR